MHAVIGMTVPSRAGKVVEMVVQLTVRGHHVVLENLRPTSGIIATLTRQKSRNSRIPLPESTSKQTGRNIFLPFINVPEIHQNALQSDKV